MSDNIIYYLRIKKNEFESFCGLSEFFLWLNTYLHILACTLIVDAKHASIISSFFFFFFFSPFLFNLSCFVLDENATIRFSVHGTRNFNIILYKISDKMVV